MVFNAREAHHDLLQLLFLALSLIAATQLQLVIWILNKVNLVVNLLDIATNIALVRLKFLHIFLDLFFLLLLGQNLVSALIHILLGKLFLILSKLYLFVDDFDAIVITAIVAREDGLASIALRPTFRAV